VGNNCCDGKSSGYRKSASSITRQHSYSSSAISTQCTGTTKKGTRCRNKTNSSSGKCHLHD
jgi:hypothetical protein